MTDLFIKCATCGGAITREAVVKLGYEWVHVDDEMTYRMDARGRFLRSSATNYDHAATPDIIDLNGPEKKSQQSLVSGESFRYVDTRPIEAVARDGSDDTGSTHTTHTQQEQ